MADIRQMVLPNGDLYNIKDNTCRNWVNALFSTDLNTFNELRSALSVCRSGLFFTCTASLEQYLTEDNSLTDGGWGYAVDIPGGTQFFVLLSSRDTKHMWQVRLNNTGTFSARTQIK